MKTKEEYNDFMCDKLNKYAIKYKKAMNKPIDLDSINAYVQGFWEAADFSIKEEFKQMEKRQQGEKMNKITLPEIDGIEFRTVVNCFDDQTEIGFKIDDALYRSTFDHVIKLDQIGKIDLSGLSDREKILCSLVATSLHQSKKNQKK